MAMLVEHFQQVPAGSTRQGDKAIHLESLIAWLLPDNQHDNTQTVGLGPQAIREDSRGKRYAPTPPPPPGGPGGPAARQPVIVPIEDAGPIRAAAAAPTAGTRPVSSRPPSCLPAAAFEHVFRTKLVQVIPPPLYRAL